MISPPLSEDIPQQNNTSNFIPDPNIRELLSLVCDKVGSVQFKVTPSVQEILSHWKKLTTCKWLMVQNYTYLKIDAEMRSMIPPTIENNENFNHHPKNKNVLNKFII